MVVFAWERTVQSWLESRLARTVPLLRAVNLLADERFVLGLAMAFAVVLDRPLVALATLASPVLEGIAKATAYRPRPHDADWGLPSGDCMIATTFWPHVLGVGAIPLLATIALARVVRGAHFPLDVVAGVALGTALWAVGR